MQGRYGDVRSSARQQYISPGLLRQRHARRTYPNSNTSRTINNETHAVKSSTKKAATKPMGFRSQAANGMDYLSHVVHDNKLCVAILSY